MGSQLGDVYGPGFGFGADSRAQSQACSPFTPFSPCQAPEGQPLVSGGRTVEYFDDAARLETVQYAINDFFEHPPHFRFNTTWDPRGDVNVVRSNCPPIGHLSSQFGPHGTFK